MFEDREDAGEKLGRELVEEGVEADIVLAIPRGGLPLGRKVADALGVELDVIVASKIGAPGNPELAIGAAAPDGRWLNQDFIERRGIDSEYIESEAEKEAEAAREKLESYRGGGQPDVEGKNLVLVDDGIATGATVKACINQLKELGAANIVVAVPVGSPATISELEEEVDRVVTVEKPGFFSSVGAFYRDFSQVSDEEARAYLER